MRSTDWVDLFIVPAMLALVLLWAVCGCKTIDSLPWEKIAEAAAKWEAEHADTPPVPDPDPVETVPAPEQPAPEPELVVSVKGYGDYKAGTHLWLVPAHPWQIADAAISTTPDWAGVVRHLGWPRYTVPTFSGQVVFRQAWTDWDDPAHPTFQPGQEAWFVHATVQRLWMGGAATPDIIGYDGGYPLVHDGRYPDPALQPWHPQGAWKTGITKTKLRNCYPPDNSFLLLRLIDGAEKVLPIGDNDFRHRGNER